MGRYFPLGLAAASVTLALVIVLRARAGPSDAFARRRRVLAVLLLANLAVAATATADVIAWAWLCVPAALLAGWLRLCRLMVAGSTPARVSTSRPPARRPVDRVRPSRPPAPAFLPAGLALARPSLASAAVVLAFAGLVGWAVGVRGGAADPASSRALVSAAEPEVEQPVASTPTAATPASPPTIVVVPQQDPTRSSRRDATRTAGAADHATTVRASKQQVISKSGSQKASILGAQRPQILAMRGSIIYIGDDGQLYANTGATSASGAVALGVNGSELKAGDSITRGEGATSTTVDRGPDVAQLKKGQRQQQAGRRTSAAQQHATGFFDTLAPKVGQRGLSTSISGFEDHSVNVMGDDQVVTYDDSNVFIDRDGLVNANTGDTDSSGLNAVDVADSTVRAGNSGDSEGSDTEEVEDGSAERVARVPGLRQGQPREGARGTAGRAARPGSSRVLRCAPAVVPSAGQSEEGDDDEESADDEATEDSVPLICSLPGNTYGTVTDEGASIASGANSFVIGADGYDDVSIRTDGSNDIVTYDDSNVVVDGQGKVNAQIGDSDTGGAVVMSIRGSDVRAGCEGDLCHRAR